MDYRQALQKFLKGLVRNCPVQDLTKVISLGGFGGNIPKELLIQEEDNKGTIPSLFLYGNEVKEFHHIFKNYGRI